MPHVLIADDEPAIRRLLALKLRAVGIEVTEAGDGDEALAAVRQRRPDLAVLDLSMPGLSGTEVCTQMRRDPALAAVPVVLLSGHTRRADVAAGLEAGAAAYLAKPFDPERIVEQLRTHLEGTPS